MHGFFSMTWGPLESYVRDLSPEFVLSLLVIAAMMMIPSLLAYWLASSKGCIDPGLWLFLTFFFPPTLLILLFIPEKQKSGPSADSSRR